MSDRIGISGNFSLYGRAEDSDPLEEGIFHRLVDGLNDSQLNRYGLNRIGVDSTPDIIIHHAVTGGVLYIPHNCERQAEYSARDGASGRAMFTQLRDAIRCGLEIIGDCGDCDS